MTHSQRLPSACLEARERIDAYLLDELDEAGTVALAEHVRGCAACSAELGGAARLIGLMRSLPEPSPAPDVDERIILAAIADHHRRHEHRNWLSSLPRTIVRGAARTTGTLIVTVVSVAILGAAFVFAAAGFIATTANNATPTPDAATDAPTIQPAAAGTETTTQAPTDTPVAPTAPPPIVILVTPEPTPAPTPESTPAPTASATSVEPTASPSASPSDSFTPSPSPTDKRRTPPPTQSPSPSPSDSSTPSASPTTSP